MQVETTPVARRMACLTLAITVTMAGANGRVEAQDNETWRDAEPASAVLGVVSVQGRLADASGAPLDGIYPVTFRFYDASV